MLLKEKFNILTHHFNNILIYHTPYLSHYLHYERKCKYETANYFKTWWIEDGLFYFNKMICDSFPLFNILKQQYLKAWHSVYFEIHLSRGLWGVSALHFQGGGGKGGTLNQTGGSLVPARTCGYRLFDLGCVMELLSIPVSSFETREWCLKMC